MGFINSAVFIIVTGIVIFIIGRFVPRDWIKPDKFTFKTFKFEKNGLIYEKLHIRYWKTKLPDASLLLSKFIPKLMPKKRLDSTSKEKIETLVKESCVAEGTHLVAGLVGFGCVLIWKKTLGKILAITYFIWNLLFVFIQRYNRPRLQMVLNKMK